MQRRSSEKLSQANAYAATLEARLLESNEGLEAGYRHMEKVGAVGRWALDGRLVGGWELGGWVGGRAELKGTGA